MRLFLAAVAAAAVLSACSTMDYAECSSADWRAIGYEDGSQGRTPTYFAKRRKACADHGITANFDAYMHGRVEGLAHFCRPHNGYNLGVRGRGYAGVCPPELEPAFMAAYSDGYGLYERQATLSSLRNQIRHNKDRASEIEYLLVDRTASLVSQDIMPADRAAIAIEIKQLAEEKAEVEESIRRLEVEYAAAEQDYEIYRDRVAYRNGN